MAYTNRTSLLVTFLSTMIALTGCTLHDDDTETITPALSSDETSCAMVGSLYAWLDADIDVTMDVGHDVRVAFYSAELSNADTPAEPTIDCGEWTPLHENGLLIGCEREPEQPAHQRIHASEFDSVTDPQSLPSSTGLFTSVDVRWLDKDGNTHTDHVVSSIDAIPCEY